MRLRIRRRPPAPDPVPPPAVRRFGPVTREHIERARQVLREMPDLDPRDPAPPLSWTQVVLTAQLQHEAAVVLNQALHRADYLAELYAQAMELP